MVKRALLLIVLIGLVSVSAAESREYQIKGRVIDKLTRQPIAYVGVALVGQENKGAPTDSAGVFVIERVNPGIYRLTASFIGYKPIITSDYQVSATTPFIEIEMEEDVNNLETVTITPSPYRLSVESPVSMHVIGTQEIEKSPGSNRDVSRIVRSFPGVAFSPVGYRNDLIVRGGGPSENRFYMDGIEIPNINHFATQGASGGPVSIVNADLIREINFYTGAFPADRSGALSSVLDFSLRDGNREKQTFKATLGASEVAFSGSGHFSERTTYLFSVRQSYLQLLFKLIGLPFLPNYIDGQVKIKTRLSDKNEIIFLGLAGIDNMKLNLDEKGEENEYLLSYLPRIWQETFTVGASWRHYAGRHTQSITLSHTYLNNRNVKYRGNDESTEDNLTLRLRSVEQKTTLRAENKSIYGRWSIKEGAELTYSDYTNRSLQRLFANSTELSNYNTHLGVVGWGIFATGSYASADNRFTASMGLCADGSNYSTKAAQIWRYLSPRVSLSYALSDGWSISGGAGVFYQQPPFTALGFKDNNGVFVNRDLEYMRVASASAGVTWRLRDRMIVSLEGFYKHYGDIPLSVADNIPLACKGNDYGVVGNERLISSATGRSYGAEAMARWQIPGKVNIVGSLTYYRSQYRNDSSASYISSAWDNRFILNMSGTYDLPRHWSVGVKVSYIGGSPYTPYDVDKSSLVDAWDAQGRPYYDYLHYNSERLSSYVQFDLRVDKTFYFRSCMLGIYIDIQNVTGSKLRQADVLMSTGVVENPSAPQSEQRYKMKYIKQESGTLIPTLGLTVEF